MNSATNTLKSPSLMADLLNQANLNIDNTFNSSAGINWVQKGIELLRPIYQANASVFF